MYDHDHELRPGEDGEVYSYYVYGLGLHSALPLPELVAGAAAADVAIHLDHVARWPAEEVPTSSGGRCRATASEVTIWYEPVGTFLIRNGAEIVVDPVPGVEAALLRPFLLGPALALLLHQRGQLVLHASAVALDGGAVAFVARPDGGKSTMAAALYARGCGLVADDIVPMNIRGAAGPLVFPAFPQLRLWPEAAVALGDVPATLPALHSQSPKRVRRVARGFSSAPLPLRRIYVLDDRPQPAIERLAPQAAFAELVRHSYLVHLLATLGTAAAHFHQCGWLLNQVPVCRLQRPRDLAMLRTVAEMVEQDLTGAGSHA